MIELMAKITLVGHFVGKTVSVWIVSKWVEEGWKADLGADPEVEGLARGWFAFNFQSE